jgi:hypothetical protein
MKRLGYILPFLICIFYFLSVKNVIPSFVYLSIIIPLSILYFPGMLILDGRTVFGLQSMGKTQKAVSYLLFSTILVISVISLYTGITGLVKHFYALIAILSTGSCIYCYFKERIGYNLLQYIGFAILAIGIISI